MPGQVGPGLSTPITAGEHYVLVDADGAELHLQGRDDPLVVDFLEAFDHYLQLRAPDSGAGEAQQGFAWASLREQFQRLPPRLQNELEYRRLKRNLR
jgi:hypothetical protein